MNGQEGTKRRLRSLNSQ